ncbi:MAG TPA: DUF1801 domain-containing protein [Actinomycetota bacterium]|nr:DUF1801 domain-containing protein [Actinomycetota bacterium]
MPDRRTVEEYIAGVGGWRGGVMTELDALVRKAAPKAASAVKWAQPVYDQNGPMIWIKPFTKHVGIGFWRGAEMDDPKGLLRGDGDRMRNLPIHEGEKIPTTAIRGFVKQAIALNEAKGDPSARRR